MTDPKGKLGQIQPNWAQKHWIPPQNANMHTKAPKEHSNKKAPLSIKEVKLQTSRPKTNRDKTFKQSKSKTRAAKARHQGQQPLEPPLMLKAKSDHGSQRQAPKKQKPRPTKCNNENRYFLSRGILPSLIRLGRVSSWCKTWVWNRTGEPGASKCTGVVHWHVVNTRLHANAKLYNKTNAQITVVRFANFCQLPWPDLMVQ